MKVIAVLLHSHMPDALVLNFKAIMFIKKQESCIVLIWNLLGSI